MHPGPNVQCREYLQLCTALYNAGSVWVRIWLKLSRKRVVDPATRRRNVALSGREDPEFVFTFCSCISHPFAVNSSLSYYSDDVWLLA